MTLTMHHRARSIRVTRSLIVAFGWFVAIWAATCLRLDLSIPSLYVRGALIFALAVVIGYLVFRYLSVPYAVGRLRGSFEENFKLSIFIVTLGVGLLLWPFLARPVVLPRGVSVSAAALAIVVVFALRFVVRTARSQAARCRRGERRTVALRAGDSGRRLLRDLLTDPSSGVIPVALLDDDRSKASLRVEGARLRRREIRDRCETTFAPYADVRLLGRSGTGSDEYDNRWPEENCYRPRRAGRRGSRHGRPEESKHRRPERVETHTVSAELRLVDDEPRMTEFGQWPRPTSLDELPTLLNVVNRHISCVGPRRPLLLQYIELHSLTEAPRHEVRAGLTGLAQVTGRDTLMWEQIPFGVHRRDVALDACILRDTVFAAASHNRINAESEETMFLLAGTFVAHESTRSGKTAS